MVDPRSPRAGAVVTSVVLAAVLLSASGPLLFVQTLIFAVGAVFGLRYAPYGVLFRILVRPRLGPPSELEEEAPPRFAQAVGAFLGGVGTIGFLAGVPGIGYAATACALAAAFLNAAFGICLGCQIYLTFRSLKGVHA